MTKPTPSPLARSKKALPRPAICDVDQINHHCPWLQYPLPASVVCDATPRFVASDLTLTDYLIDFVAYRIRLSLHYAADVLLPFGHFTAVLLLNPITGQVAGTYTLHVTDAPSWPTYTADLINTPPPNGRLIFENPSPQQAPTLLLATFLLPDCKSQPLPSPFTNAFNEAYGPHPLG